MAAVVYLLCALTSLLCAVLLLRAWAASRQRLVLWTGLGFAGLAGNNLLLLIDRSVLPDVDLQLLRDLSGLLAVSVILAGLIWESR
ncbi:MAG TPA: DUF5985 family protein [Mycobacteriales bacterium]|nr:DUF5985 family protein [Mycobacteriales bacterium]